MRERRAAGSQAFLLAVCFASALGCVGCAPTSEDSGSEDFHAAGATCCDGGSPPASEPTCGPFVLGHRGMGTSSADNAFPENTLASIRAALRNGAEGVEIDLQLTADDVLVLAHDDALAPDHVSGCSGYISTQTLEELQACRVLAGSPEGDPQPLTTLEQVLDLGPMALLWLDMKNDLSGHRRERAIEVAAALIRELDDAEYVVMGLYETGSRELAQELGVQSCLKYHGHLGWSEKEMVENTLLTDSWGACFNEALFTPSLGEQLLDNAQHSMWYLISHTISERELYDTLAGMNAFEVDGLLTDRVALARRARDELCEDLLR